MSEASDMIRQKFPGKRVYYLKPRELDAAIVMVEEKLDDPVNGLRLVYGKEALKPSVFKQLKQLKHIKLLYLKNFHGKCYFNEKSMVITSLNLYDYSEQNNRELGVLITREDDKEG